MHLCHSLHQLSPRLVLTLSLSLHPSLRLATRDLRISRKIQELRTLRSLVQALALAVSSGMNSLYHARGKGHFNACFRKL